LETKEAETETTTGKGLTWRAIVMILYAAIVFQPVAIWLDWVSGPVGIVLAVEYTVLLFASTLADFSGKPLSRQEAWIIYATTGTVVLETIFSKVFLFNYYKARSSPTAYGFGLTEVIPGWFAPPAGLQTFLDPSWITPILLWLFFFGVLSKVADISLGYFFNRVYQVEEKLEFPFQRVWAAACITMAEKARRPKQLKVFTLSAIIGIFYGLLLYAPALVLGRSVLPIPWVDLTGAIGGFLPGASIGIATDIYWFIFGFIIPWPVIVSMFMGAIAVYVIGNHLLVASGAWLGTEGLGLGTLRWQSQQNFWASPIIGLSIAAGVVPLILGRKYIVNAFKRHSSPKAISEKGEGIPTWIPLLLFVAAAGGSVILSHILAPDFPIWLFVALSIGWSFLSNIISGRALGETGLEFFVPYVREGSYVAAGYLYNPATGYGLNAWFAPIYIGSTGVGWIGGFAGTRFTGTSNRDYIKAYILAVPLTYVLSFIFTQAFWTIAPVPSAAYPYAAADWPVRSLFELLWIRSPFSVIKPIWVVIPFIVGSTVSLLSTAFKIPFVLISFGVGISQPIPLTVSILIGGILGKLMVRKFGKQWWDEYKSVIVAGVLLGEGVIIAISAALMLISKAMWISPI